MLRDYHAFYAYFCQNADQIFGGDIKNHLLLFMKKSSAEHDAAVEAMRTVAKANKGKVCLLAFLFHLNFVMLCMLVKLRLDD